MNKLQIRAKEKFIERLNKINYSMKSLYEGTKKQIQLECNKGHTYTTTPDKIRSGYKCPKCAGCCPIEAKKNFLSQAKNMGYCVIGEYKNSSSKIELKCINNHTIFKSPNQLSKSPNCTKCRDSVYVKLKLYLVNINYHSDCSDKVKSHDTINVVCDNNHQFKIKAYSLYLNKSSCPHCKGRTEKSFICMLNKYGYTLLSEYVNTRTPVDLLCSKGHKYNTPPNRFKNGHRCPVCNSRGYNSNCSGYIYIHEIYEDGDFPFALKFGITNKEPEHRLSIINYQSKYEHKLVYKKYFTDGNIPIVIENYIKNKYSSKLSYCDKKYMKDGYTETMPVVYIYEIIKIIDNYL